MAPSPPDESRPERPPARRAVSLSALQIGGVVLAWIVLGFVWGKDRPSPDWGLGVVAVALALLTALFLVLAIEKGRWHTMEQRRVWRRRGSRGAPPHPDEPGDHVVAGHRRAVLRAVAGGLARLATLGLLVGGLLVLAREADLRPGHTVFLAAVTILALVVAWEVARWRRMERERVAGRRQARGLVRWPRLRAPAHRADATPACRPTTTRRWRVTEHGQWKGAAAMILVVAGCLATVLAVFLSFANR